MRKIFFLLFFISIFGNLAYGFGGCDENCVKCHSLAKEEAQKILDKFSPDVKIKVEDVKTSPSKGLWELVLTTNEGKTITYLDYAKKHLIVGRLIAIDTKEDLTQVRYAEVSRVDVKSIPLNNALYMGNKDADKKLIVFTDPECPFCKKLHGELANLIKLKTDVGIYIILYPLTKLHPDSLRKSQIILCKNSIELLEASFRGEVIDGKPDCDNKTLIDENIGVAKNLGISGTPSIVFPDGRVIAGSLNVSDIISELGK
ncbi:MAG: DsbC family protein [Candidatus Magnetoovum sp. WYHC-5]|nr:DsbC family protein [Candidatus Magnetoovum sp. WYHC-5]